MSETAKPTYKIGLDISTSCTGVCLIDDKENLIALDAIKLTSTSLTNMWQKADRTIQEIQRIGSGYPVDRIFVEANAKMFSKGFSSADTLLTLAKFNGIVSYLAHKHFSAEVYDINVTSARKAVGFKNTKADKRPVKDKVFEYVTALHPQFPWKRHVAKTGSHKGQVVFDAEMKDASDAWVICVGGHRLNP